jgi:hypothetical protein
MAKPRVKNEKTLNAIKVARLVEKSARDAARRRLEALIDNEVKIEHEKVLETVRVAILEGHSVRQIGFAYGSSDPYTAKRIVTEALADMRDEETPEEVRNWRVFLNEDNPDTFDVQVYSLGENNVSGRATFTLDEDGENITAVDGDLWISIQLYRLDLVNDIVKEYHEQR